MAERKKTTPVPQGQGAVKPRGTRSRASSKRAIYKVVRADAAATRRFRVTQYAQTVPGTLEVKYAAVKEAIKQGVLPGPPPGFSTLYKWLKKAETGAKTIDDFRAKKPPGAPPIELHPEVLREMQRLIALQDTPYASQIHKAVEKFAKEHGLTAPSYYKVNQFISELDPAEIAAARHGSRAAILDAMPSSTVPVEYTHEVWVLDEGLLPVWVRVWDRRGKIFIAIKVIVILILDARSRAIVAYHIVDPRGREHLGGFDRDDVMGCFVSGALPELAPPATRMFSGYLPATLRWDNAPQHKAIAAELDECGIRVPTLRSQMPKANGRVERPIQTVKRLVYDIKGFDEKWVPAERIGDHPRKQRTRGAASLKRVPTQIPIAVEDLLTVDELRAEVDQRIHSYNCENVHSVLGSTPQDAYFERFRMSETRSGSDALYLLPPGQVHVSKEGIVHSRNSRRGVFACENQGRTLRVGEKVQFRADPLLRGIFAEVWGETVFFPRLEEWAKSMPPGEFAKRQAALAREYSDNAAAAREEHQVAVLGRDGAARAQEIVAQNTKPKRRGRPSKAAAPATSPAAAPTAALHTSVAVARGQGGPIRGPSTAPPQRGVIRNARSMIRLVRD